MTTFRKLAMFASAALVAAALFACGDDDGGGGNNNNNPETGTTDGPPTTDGPAPVDGGKDGNVDLTSFPKYVQSLILLKTDDKGVPDKETVWGTIPDDDKFVFPATFFP